MKRLWKTALILGTAALLPRASADDRAGSDEPPVAAGTLSVPSLEFEAGARNPALRAARARWDAAKSEMPQASAWEDPQAEVDFGHDLTQANNDTSVQWSLGQQIPWPGTTSARVSAAESEAVAALADLRQEECEVGAQIRVAAARMAEARAQLDLNRRNRDLLIRLIDTGRGRYESGQGNETDVLMAETELARNDEARADWLRAYADAQADIDTLLDRPPTEPLGAPVPLDPSPAEPPSLDALQALASAHSPVLLAAASRRDAAQTRIGLAELERRPRLEMSIQGRQFNGPGPAFQAYGAGVAISLPWANDRRHKAEVLEARKNAEAEQADLEAMEAETAGHVREIWQEYATSRHHAELYRTRVLPISRRTTEAARIAYEAGRGSFGDVIFALRAERDAESDLIGHLASCQVALASLGPLTGDRLPPPFLPPTP
jgi:outer membrane protein TolC